MTFIIHTEIEISECDLLDKIQDEGGYSNVIVSESDENEYTITIPEDQCDDEDDILDHLQELANEVVEDSMLW